MVLTRPAAVTSFVLRQEQAMATIPKIHQLRISLNRIKPPMLWRRFQARGDISLLELHDIIQSVMG